MKPLDDDEFNRYVASRIADAVDYIDDEIAEDRETATRFYHGDVSEYLPSIKGRSTVVSYDVRDTVLRILPSLLRIYASGKKAVEFCPEGYEDVEGAAQATDYCNHIFYNDNDGFDFLHSAFKDGLVRKLGIGKVWWETETKVEARRYEGLDDDSFAAFVAEAESVEGVDITEHEARADAQGLLLHDFTVETRKTGGKACVEALPPEEFLIDRRAKTNGEGASILAHRCYKRVGELAAMGYDFDEMLELSGNGESFAVNEERNARNPFDDFQSDDDGGDPAMRTVLYIEAYVRCDADGDGVLEWRKVCCAGTTYKVLHQELVDDHPFAFFCPEPEPHTFFGLCPADMTMDMQLNRTQMLRLHNDSLAQVVTPRTIALTNAGLNMQQVADNRIGAIIQANRPDALTPAPTDKSAPAAAMAAYQAFGEIIRDRTGINQASMGLTPDALQSVSRIAANEMVQQGQQSTEMIARFFGEGMRRVFRLLLRLVTRYQERERIIRLRNKFVPMNPRQWSPDMDVQINVGLGTGNVEEKAAFFREILQIQQQIMQAAGPQNPWVDAEKIRATLEDAVESSGRQFERYFLSSDEWAQMQQKMQQQPLEPPKPDPAEMIAQVESKKIEADIQNQREKTQADIQAKTAKMQADDLHERMRDDLARDKLDADIVMQAAKMGIQPEQTLAFIQRQRALSASGGTQ
jgi:hypothetical protein